VPLGAISPHLVAATLASEDRRFFEHHGVDPVGLARATLLNLLRGRLAFGGSTITMQLVKLVDRPSRGLWGKAVQMVLAARLERAADKRAILEQYLNRVYYGHGAWGAEAAARRYFGRAAENLSAGEAALLAVLPRSPRAYDPVAHLDEALRRRHHVLDLMVEQGRLDEAARRAAEATPLALRLEPAGFRAPHFVDHVLAGLDETARRGAVVRTTLDGPLQERLEVALDEHLRAVGGRGATQAGVVVLRNRDGAVLAMVGSRDFGDAAGDGQVNAVTARHRPGSTLKPWVYGLALERGDTPATVAVDVVLPHEAQKSYTKDVRQHGFARYRESLAGSYNLAAVHTLERVGVPALVERLRRSGVTLDRAPREGGYDLNLAIGEAEVSLLELTSAFSAFGRDGTWVPPRAVAEVVRPGAAPLRPPPVEPTRIFAREVAWLLFDILRDPDARRPMFGGRAPLYLPFPVAVKTGTTRAYTDNLALGTTREFTVGVWAGNFDGTPMHTMMAMEGAAPLVRAAFVALAARFGDPTAPERPDGIEEGVVCALSGMAPTADCPVHKRDVFRAGTAPTTPCTWHRRDGAGRIAVDYPAALRPWARFQGLLPDGRRRPVAVAAGEPLRILAPRDGARFALDPHRPPEAQVPPLTAAPVGAPVRWSIDGRPAARFRPSPGPHVVRAEWGGAVEEVTVQFD
jgi:penicillin-binding protein 1C